MTAQTETMTEAAALPEWARLFAHYTAIFRRLRPEWPQALVFEVDAGMPDSPNCRMVAQTGTAEGDEEISVAKLWLREQPEFAEIVGPAAD